MTKYMKRPVVIEAIQWLGNNVWEVAEFLESGARKFHADIDVDKKTIAIETLEGTMTASQYDYIIKGIKGEFYPCKPDIFNETYELYLGGF